MYTELFPSDLARIQFDTRGNKVCAQRFINLLLLWTEKLKRAMLVSDSF